MSSNSSAPPPPPNLTTAAHDQGIQNERLRQRQTQENRPDVNNPFSSTKWTLGPDGKWAQSTSLSEGLMPGQPLDWSQFGKVGTGDEARNQAIDASYKQATSRLDPMWQQREAMQRTQMMNQGIDPNSAAARSANLQQSQQRNDAYGSAMNSAIMMGQSAGDSVFRNNSMAHQQAIADALKARSNPVDEAKNALGLMPGSPTNATSGRGQAADITGAMQTDYLNKYGAWNDEQQRQAEQLAAILGVPLSIIQGGSKIAAAAAGAPGMGG